MEAVGVHFKSPELDYLTTLRHNDEKPLQIVTHCAGRPRQLVSTLLLETDGFSSGASVSHAGKIRDLKKKQEMEINVAELQEVKGTVGHAHFLPVCAAPWSAWLNADYFSQISWGGGLVVGCPCNICVCKHLRVSLKPFTHKAALGLKIVFAVDGKRKRLNAKAFPMSTVVFTVSPAH